MESKFFSDQQPSGLRPENQQQAAFIDLLMRVVPKQWDQGGATNQTQANDYQPDEPQSLRYSYNFKDKHCLLPCNFQQVEVEIKLDPELTDIFESEVTFTTYYVEPDIDSISSWSSTISFLHALRELSTMHEEGASIDRKYKHLDYRLEEMYILSGLIRELGVPKNLFTDEPDVEPQYLNRVKELMAQGKVQSQMDKATNLGIHSEDENGHS